MIDLNASIAQDLAATMTTATGGAAVAIITAAIELIESDEPCDVTALGQIIPTLGINGGDTRAMAVEAIRIIGSL